MSIASEIYSLAMAERITSIVATEIKYKFTESCDASKRVFELSVQAERNFDKFNNALADEKLRR